MNDCSTLLSEFKKEPVEVKQEDTIIESNPGLKSLETENVSPTHQSPQDATDEEVDFKTASAAHGNGDMLAKESSVTMPPVITVKCGTLTAQMVTKLFTCPGIHQNCILIDGETEYISPKEFTVRANKDKQKDWKGSIRIGKSNLRTLMEMRSLDFHDHPNQCSAKCQSRNYITPKDPSSEHNAGRRRSSATKLIPQNMFSQVSSFPSATPSLFSVPKKENPLPDSQPTLGTLFKNPTFSRFVAISQSVKNNNFTAPATPQPTMSFMPTTSVKEELATVDDVNQQLLQQQQRVAAANAVLQSVPSQPSTLWNVESRVSGYQDQQEFMLEMINAGLGDHLIDMIVTKINNMRERVKGIPSCSNIMFKLICSLNAAETFVNTIQAMDSMQAEISKEDKLVIRNQAHVHRLSSDFSSLEDESPGRKRSLDVADLIGQPVPKRPSITTSTPEDAPETTSVPLVKPIAQPPKVISHQEMLMNIASTMSSSIDRNHVLAALQMEELRTAAAQ